MDEALRNRLILDMERLEHDMKQLRNDMEKMWAKIDGDAEPDIKAKPDYLDKVLIKDMDLSHKTFAALGRGGINTLKDLSEKSVEELRSLRNIGPVAIAEINKQLKEYGIELLERKMHSLWM